MVFGFLNKAAAKFSVDLIAKKASSQEAFDTGVSTAFTQKEIIENYFKKYGSTEKKFEYYQVPEFYIGYVRTSSHREFLSVVLISPEGSVVTSFYADFGGGQDFLSLMRKKSFADEVATRFVEAASE